MGEDRSEYLDALRKASWQNTDDDGHPIGVRRIHTLAGGMGADWDLNGAVDFVASAEQVGWANSFMGHCLVAEKDGRLVQFEVPLPPPRHRTQMGGSPIWVEVDHSLCIELVLRDALGNVRAKATVTDVAALIGALRQARAVVVRAEAMGRDRRG